MSATITTEPFFQPVALPQQLMNLFEHMQQLAAEPSGHKAALAVVEEYYNFFGPTGMRKDMWLLYSAAMCSRHLPGLQDSDERYNVLFFYEFTLMLLDAVYLLHCNGCPGKLQ